jgi:hypothetical protein
MKRIAYLSALLAVSLMTGCVERRFVVQSDPPGALIFHNGIYLGPTPADGYVTYYGKQKFTLMKAGYETLDVVQTYDPPWYEWPGIDFLSENVWPFKVRDVRCFTYTLQPLQTARPDEVRQRGEALRSEGQAIGVPREPRPVGPTTQPPPPPPGTILGPPTPVAQPPVPAPSAPPQTRPFLGDVIAPSRP